MQSLTVKSRYSTDLVDITREVEGVVKRSRVERGICYIFVPHTTAGVVLNENADPSVRKDIINALERLVPWEGPYTHGEGNAAAHIKAALVGSSQNVPIVKGRLALGTWQGIFLCDFDGPRDRQVMVQPIEAEATDD
ncbi:MAG TPA: secondary thiamine-phosphate synthase enzyme YjbQ [Candidatus Hypogeohydataceae bacterium YC38]|nr:secondary thiamine-phosphate synthase enzyme YjbQ [Candidatus Brocadiales bacterium]